MRFRFKVGDRVKLANPLDEGWSSTYVNRVGVIKEAANYNMAEPSPVYLIDFDDPPGATRQRSGWFGEQWITLAENGIERARKCLK